MKCDFIHVANYLFGLMLCKVLDIVLSHERELTS